MNPREKAANKEAFSRMSRLEKLDYIRTYYWGPILLGVIAVIILGTSLYRHFTKKEQILYTACINTVIGDELENALHQEYLRERGLDPKKSEILFYRNLYLSENASQENHEIAYASRMKLLAVINSKKLDLALMNREAYDILSQSDYLMDLTELAETDRELYQKLEPFLTENTVIVEDNAIEYNLREADTYRAVTKEVINGIDLSEIPVIRNAGFPESVYLGIIANTPRLTECCKYLKFILLQEHITE